MRAIHPFTSRNNLWLMLLAFMLGLVPSRAQSNLFYRVNASTNTIIVSLNGAGLLTWSNAATTGTYLVEKNASLSNSAWSPLSRNDISNVVTSIPVCDLAAPTDMAFLPGGKFSMGDSFNELPGGLALPVHTVYLSPFYIKKHHVNNEEARCVLQWAYDHGYIAPNSTNIPSTDGTTNVLFALNSGLGFGPGHDSDLSFNSGVFSVKPGRTNYPIVWVNWYGAVAYCNFLSAMEGRDQCYDLTNWTCDFTKNGYRLPTEAEREFAGRGGYEGMRFPWSDTNIVTHARANYKSDTNNYPYDLGPTPGFTPAYSNTYPATPCSNPVDAYPPNNFGLCDMAGNVWDWCWDWGGRYPSFAVVDPTGPATGTGKNFRGGSWLTVPSSVTCAQRYYANPPTFYFNDVGFRPAMRFSH